jgi:DNA polymerase I-like protein with 3'-5' exonuclease and polymerase domains
LEVPFEETEEVKKIVAEEMMKAADLKVKLEVSVASGSDWEAAH